jgi:hypothetical protein
MCYFFRDPDGKKLRKKEKAKSKHGKKTPKLTIIGLDKEMEVVECQLETAKHPTVSFKFNKDEDKPKDIAETLVSSILL